MIFRTAFKGFVAGAVATLVFHQGFLWLLGRFLSSPYKPWNVAANGYGVPSVLALAFWGGVWGIALCAVVAGLTRGRALLWGAVLGSVVPSAWAWTVLAAMHGRPFFGGSDPKLIVGALLVNAVWGLATVALFHAMRGRRPRRRGILG